jgi:hypothetical protein
VIVNGVDIAAGLAPSDSLVSETNGGNVTIFH